MTRKRAFTILETIISVFIFGLLLSSLFLVYSTGANAWMKSDTDAESLGAAQVLATRLARVAERSSFLSVNIHDPQPEALSLLSPVDNNGEFQFDIYTKRPIWQKYVVFYRDSATGEVRETEIPVLGTPAEKSPLKLEGILIPADLSTHMTGGRLLVSNAESLDFQFFPTDITRHANGNETIEMTLRVGKDVRGQTDLRTLETKIVVKFRN